MSNIVLVLIVTPTHWMARDWSVWDERLVPPARGKQYHNPRRNGERWLRRWAKQ